MGKLRTQNKKINSWQRSHLTLFIKEAMHRAYSNKFWLYLRQFRKQSLSTYIIKSLQIIVLNPAFLRHRWLDLKLQYSNKVHYCQRIIIERRHIALLATNEFWFLSKFQFFFVVWIYEKQIKYVAAIIMKNVFFRYFIRCTAKTFCL